MQISRRIVVACVTATILFPNFLPAAETEAQIKARQALEEKMNELATQPVTPAPAKPAAPKAKKEIPVTPAAPVAQPTPSFTQPAPVVPAVKAEPPPEPKTSSTMVFEPVPEPASNADAEKAREALRQKMNEMGQQPIVVQSTSQGP